MRKNQDGYILVYVLVVILTLSMFAVGLMSHALKNHNIQKNAVTYTQDKYDAEGMIEQFVAELKALAETGAYANKSELESAIGGVVPSDVDASLSSTDENEYIVSLTANSETVSVITEIKVICSNPEGTELTINNIECIAYEITQREDA